MTKRKRANAILIDLNAGEEVSTWLALEYSGSFWMAIHESRAWRGNFPVSRYEEQSENWCCYASDWMQGIISSSWGHRG